MRPSRTTGSGPAYTHSACAALAATRTGSTGRPTPDEKPSPLGDLVAQASDEGYAKSQTEGSSFWGYRFRILTGQGGAAPGGKKDYVVNGDMAGGFGLVAYPARYGSSGVMTFIVNRDGVVYQKDLGEGHAESGRQYDGVQPRQRMGTRADALAC